MDNKPLIQEGDNMTGDNHERRLSTVEANFGNVAASLNKMEGYLGKLFDQNGEIKTSVALVVQNQAEMKIYQKTCDKDRGDMKADIADCMNFKKSLRNYAIGLFGVGSLASPQLAKLWERFMT